MSQQEYKLYTALFTAAVEIQKSSADLTVLRLRPGYFGLKAFCSNLIEEMMLMMMIIQVEYAPPLMAS